VEVELALSDQFVDLVAEGFDLGFRAGILPVNEYVSRLLLPVTPLVCAAPEHAARHGLPASIAQIAAHRCIGMRSNPSGAVLSWEFAGPGGAVLRHEIAPAFVVNEPEALALACAAGMGLAQIGSNVAMPLLRAGRLVTALTDRAVQSRGIYAVHPSRRFLPRRLTLFLEHARDAFARRQDLLPPPASTPAEGAR
jgi:DNA-binding transcriptional LysR family regulator